ncbi:MAG: hypothetical protein PVI76_04755, partial [Desulfobacterales bacterium]
KKASLIPLKNILVTPRTPNRLIVLFKPLKITTIVNTKIKLGYARFFLTLVSNNSWSGHRRLLLRFHTAQNSAPIIFMLRYGPQGHEPFTKIIFFEGVAILSATPSENIRVPSAAWPAAY